MSNRAKQIMEIKAPELFVEMHAQTSKAPNNYREINWGQGVKLYDWFSDTDYQKWSLRQKYKMFFKFHYGLFWTPYTMHYKNL